MKKTMPTYTKDVAISQDGTSIGYRQMGNGPALLLLHGGVNASQHLMKLGTALSDAFTLFIPDRCGRGLSGPLGDAYSIQKEGEDLDALLKKRVLSSSSGRQTERSLPCTQRSRCLQSRESSPMNRFFSWANQG